MLAVIYMLQNLREQVLSETPACCLLFCGSFLHFFVYSQKGDKVMTTGQFLLGLSTVFVSCEVYYENCHTDKFQHQNGVQSVVI